MEFVSGSADVLSEGGYIEPPFDPETQTLCNQQKISNTEEYQNFSLLGISVILVPEAIFIVLGPLMSAIVGRLQKLFANHYRRLVWRSEGDLQVARIAFKVAKYRDWRGCVGSYLSMEIKREVCHSLAV